MPTDPQGDPDNDAALIAAFAGHPIERDRAAHYRARLQHRLLVNRCDDCGHWHEPPRPMCPACWSWNVTPTEVSGRGTVHLLMWLHQGPPAEGVDYDNGGYGHPVVTVELAEQEHLRITGTAVGFEPDDLVIGAAVELDWIERNGAPLPAFRPARDGEVAAQSRIKTAQSMIANLLIIE